MKTNKLDIRQQLLDCLQHDDALTELSIQNLTALISTEVAKARHDELRLVPRRILFNRAVVEGADRIKKAYYDAQNAPLTEAEQKDWDEYTTPKEDSK